MSGRRFLDTNVLVYAYDASEALKQRRAQDILLEGLAQGDVISTQVLGEFYVTVTRKIPNPFTPAEAAEVLRTLAVLLVVSIDWPTVQQAVSKHQRFSLSYWDALVLASAHRAGCTKLLTEDLNPGQDYDGVAVENPFDGL